VAQGGSAARAADAVLDIAAGGTAFRPAGAVGAAAGAHAA